MAGLVGELGLTGESRVLDLAAGTGRFTEVLVPVVCEVIAVEPSEAMLGSLRRRLPTVDARDGSAEAIPLPDDSVQAVFVAEAFHWFRTGEAAVEIARVLELFEPFCTTSARSSTNSAARTSSLVASWSWMAILPLEQRKSALSLVRELIGSGSRVALHYRTGFQHAQLR